MNLRLDTTTRAMRLSTPACLALACLAAISGCVNGEEENTPIPAARTELRSEMLGCYALYTRRGTPLDSTVFYHASPVVRLDSSSVRSSQNDVPTADGRRHLHRLSATLQPLSRDERHIPWESWWSDRDTDTLRIGLSTGFSGTMLALAPVTTTADTLRGRVEVRWDSGPPFVTDRTRALAVRIPCEPQA